MTILSDIYDDSICWQMSRAERASILHLIHLIPEKYLAVELGCYKGGFLRQLAKRFKKVNSFDLNHVGINKEDYTNVNFIKGDSKTTFTIDQYASFILIDGDHSYKAVSNDIKRVLYFTPKQEAVVLVHDSWYEQTRFAVTDGQLFNNHYIHLVDLDFCPGSWTGKEWMGGLALIHLLPEKRTGELVIKSSEQISYKKVSKL